VGLDASASAPEPTADGCYKLFDIPSCSHDESQNPLGVNYFTVGEDSVYAD